MPSGSGEVPVLRGYGELEEIGRGGFSVVYRARQEQFAREVAIKVLAVDHVDAATRRRFARECAVMGALSWHPHIVVVYDTGLTTAERPYLVMEYLPKGSLADRLRREGPVDWPDAVRLTVELAGALETAHEGEVLHRDVKPANAFVDLYGRAKLGDFGIASLAAGGETTAGESAFTVLHAAPEVLSGHPATVQSDVYSLGSTLFTLLTGTAAFHREGDESAAAALLRALNDPVPDLRTVGVPDDVATVIEVAMAKDPTARPDAKGFGELLRSAQRAHGQTETDLWLHPERSAEAGAVALALDDPADHTVPNVRTPQPRSRPVADDGATVVGAHTPVPPRPVVSSPPGRAGTRPEPVGQGRDRPASRRRIVVGMTVLIALVVAVGALALSRRGDEGGPEAEAAAMTSGPGTSEEELEAHEVLSRPLDLGAGDAVRIVVTPDGDFDPAVTLAAPYAGLAVDERFVASSFADPFERFFDDLEPDTACAFPDDDVPVADVTCDDGAVLPGFVADDGAAGEQEVVAAFAPVDGRYEVLVRGAGNSAGSFTLTVQTAPPPPGFDIDDFFADDQVPFYRRYLVSERTFFCSTDGVDDTTDFADHESSLIVYCDPEAFATAFGDG